MRTIDGNSALALDNLGSCVSLLYDCAAGSDLAMLPEVNLTSTERSFYGNLANGGDDFK